jgi:transcriptional regulator with PAS, ATPase and Fis domain
MRLTILTTNEVLTHHDITFFEIDLSNKEKQEKPPLDTVRLITLNPDTLNSMELKIIDWYMNHYNGNKTKVCEALGISRTTLWKKLKDIKDYC